MSRSHHATRREPRDPGDLERKRRVKAVVAGEQVRPRDLPPIVTGDAVAITAEDHHGPFVHHPASVDDLRAVIARLPAGSMDGIARIELRLGRIVEHDDARSDQVPDPLVGRPGGEIMPGVYARRVIGTYAPSEQRIQLFAYVYDANRADRGVLELYLRLRQLATFMHELGHHRERVTRVARGRWMADDVDDSEIYAEAIEHAWTASVVVPYLEDRYPTEVAALRAWLIEHGGIALPLEVLAGDPRTTLGRGGVRLYFGVNGAFEQLMKDVAAGARSPATQIQFAEELHFGENYDEALAILARVLADDPDHAGALSLRGDIFVHQERLVEAEAIARDLLVRDPDDVDAWDILGDVARSRSDWPALHAAADHLVRLYEPDRGWRWRMHLERRARARIELADETGAMTDIAALHEAAVSPRTARMAALLRAYGQLRRGDHAEAHALALRALADGTAYARWPLVAVQVEAALQLGLAHEIDVSDLCERLRNLGEAAWADRIEALRSPPPP